MFWLAALAVAATVTTPVDTFDRAEAWSVNPDGGGGVSFRAEAGALHISYTADAPNKWGNLLRRVSLPADFLAVKLRLKVLKATPGAAMHLWLLERDGDAHMCEIRAQNRPVGELDPGAWVDVRVPRTALAFQPRGNGKPDLPSVDRMLLGCNYEPLEVLVDDLAFDSGPPPAAKPLPRSATWQPVDGPRGRVALWDEPELATTPGGFDWPAVERALSGAGYGVTRVRSGDLADRARLNRDTFDVVLLNAPAFPLAAKATFWAYLKAGGAFLSAGGYTFDRPLAYTDAGWEEVPPESEQARLNARRGKPGDTMALEPDQIGLFDPTVRLTRVSEIELGGKRLSTTVEGLAGVSLAGSNSPVFPDQHGETEFLGQALDRFGRPRGALGVLAQFYAGPFAGGAWGGFGVTSRNLFAADAFGMAPLLASVERLVSGVFVHSLVADKPMVRAGETVTVSCQVRNRGRRPVSGEVRLKREGAMWASRQVTLPPGGSQAVSAQWAPATFERDLYGVTAELWLDGQRVDTRESAFCAEQRPAAKARPALAWRGNFFEVNGRPQFFTGTNQTGVMWHSPRENPLTWERDFAAMEDHGLTVWRVLHFSPFGTKVGDRYTSDVKLLANDPPDHLIRQTDAIVQLAQKHGVVLFPCAHDWIGLALSDEELAAEQHWNTFWSRRYRDVPGLIWDIQNEPTVEFEPDAAVPRQLYERFLTEHHGSLAAARTWLGLAADAPLVPKAGNGAWSDLRAVAVEEFRIWLLNRWVKANVDSLKAGNPNVPVTVGYLQMRHNADKAVGTRFLDFGNAHSYDSSRQFGTSLKFVDRRAYGKGMTLGEFGGRTLHGLRVNGGDGEAGDADRKLFNTTVGLTAAGGGAMALNWCFRGLPDVIFPWELFRSDRVARPPLADYTALTAALHSLEPVYDPPQVYLLQPDQHRLGPHYGELDTALARSVETLWGLHVPFSLLNEQDLVFPPEARVILWPLPYCPADATFAAVTQWVAAGGHLYLSGDVGFDEQRHYTRGDRLTQLGLPAAAGKDPFSVADTGQPAQSVTVGKGRVTFVPTPVELNGAARLRTLYTDVLAAAGAARLPLTPDSPEVQTGTVKGRDGSTLWLAASWGEARDVTFDGKVTLHIDRDNLGWVRLAANGDVLGAMAQGPVRDTAGAISSGGAMVLSLDGHDVRRSASLAVWPLGAAELRLASAQAWRAPAAHLGEFRGGWQALGTLPLRRGAAELQLSLGEDCLGTVLLVTEADADVPRVADLALRGSRP